MRGLGETVGVLCYIVALANMPIADVIAMSQTAPLILILAAVLLWREVVGALRLSLVALGFAGAVLVAQPTGSGITIYALLSFATAVMIAVRDLVGRRVPPSVPAFVVTFSTVILVMGAAGVMTLATERWALPRTTHFAYLALAGLFVTLGHVFIFIAYRLGSPRNIAPFFYSFAVWAVIAGLVVWREVPNALAALGIVLIVGSGLAIVSLNRRRMPA
jgi:drug/metabolite transporter (DMT)-like permease